MDKSANLKGPTIYRSGNLHEACLVISGAYNRKLDYIADMVYEDFFNKGQKGFYCTKKKLTREKMKSFISALIGEYYLNDMLNWLDTERGWSIKYPIQGEFMTEYGKVTAKSIGKQISVKSFISGDAGLDVLFTIEGDMIIGEAKSGVNEIDIFNDVDKRVKRLSEVMEIDPGYVLSIPVDNKIRYDGRLQEVLSKGGEVVILPTSSEKINEKAMQIAVSRKSMLKNMNMMERKRRA